MKIFTYALSSVALAATLSVAQAADVPDALSVEWQGNHPCEKLFEDAQVLVARCTFPPVGQRQNTSSPRSTTSATSCSPPDIGPPTWPSPAPPRARRPCLLPDRQRLFALLVRGRRGVRPDRLGARLCLRPVRYDVSPAFQCQWNAGALSRHRPWQRSASCEARSWRNCCGTDRDGPAMSRSGWA